ncbi:hypothetical protein GGI07_002666 [Coemansia sp. Benny D115]|nr:hypothetical protein GGI07_002666 [Coemansia sp. Benny D115]
MSNKGKQPRVKGNLKPTSSSRAADLLGGDMAAINAFKANPALAFSQFSRSAASGSGSGSGSPGSAHETGASSTQKPSSKISTPPLRSGASTPVQSALDQIDGQLAAQLKRLGKPDSKTKMRALFELKSYVTEHTWETGLQGMLLAWSPLFQKHIFDPDRRVRAAVAGVNAALLSKTGKRLAPYLKQIIGAWVASFFDPHREVARSSRTAFEKVFPEAKRAEVYSYCVSELIEFASDNIVNQTAETLSDPRFVDAEDMRSKYEHVIGASFGTLTLAVEEVAPEKLLEHQAQFDDLLANKTALKFLSNHSSFIRRSVYRMIRAIMLRCPEVARASCVPLAQALLRNCFEDTDPNAHGDMWDAVLLMTKNYPQVWLDDARAEGKKKTSALDRLFEFLRVRCRLSPTISYPSILALLANLPAEVLDAPSFQPTFNSALWQGAAHMDEQNSSPSSKLDGATGSRTAHQESVALVSAICECYSFLWTRSLKNAQQAGSAGPSSNSACEHVSKEASREADRLWHFYLQHGESAEEMSLPVVKLYCKIEALSAKYDASLLSNIWAQTSWFAQRRLLGDAIHPVVFLVSQMAALDVAAHHELVACARKLLVDFCQHAIQAPDSATAQSLIQNLSQLAPDIVFQEGFSTKFSVRLEGCGSSDEAVDLALSKAQYLLDSTGSPADAAQSIDSFGSSTLSRAHTADTETQDASYHLVTSLLAALQASAIQKSSGWNDLARLPLLGRSILSALPSLPANAKVLLSAESPAPSLDLVRLLHQSLKTHFIGDNNLIEANVVDEIIGWMEGVFMALYGVLYIQDGSSVTPSLNSWISTTHEVLSCWTSLTRDSATGPRFVRFWLKKSGSQAHSALGLLFDFAITTSDATDSDRSNAAAAVLAKLHPQAKRARNATEAQLEKLSLGSELAKVLSDSISHDLADLDVGKSPSHLARLANSVYTRICPQADAQALRSLVYGWVGDINAWARSLDDDSDAVFGTSGQTDRYLSLASAAGTSGLHQAIGDFDETKTARSFHTLAHWESNFAHSPKSLKSAATAPVPIYDAFGLSRFARRAMFAIEFIQLSGGLSVLSSFADLQLAEFIRQMTLAYVLLRESLILASNSLAEADSDSDSDGASGDQRGCARIPVVSVVDQNISSSLMCVNIESAIRSIQELVSDILDLVAVQDISLSQSLGHGSDSADGTPSKPPRDPIRWLSTLVGYTTSDSSDDSCSPESTWEHIVAPCIASSRANSDSPWVLVLGVLMEWCQWSYPLASIDVEAAVASPLSRRLSVSHKHVDVSWTALVTVLVRAVDLRQKCVQSPALHSALLDVIGQLSKSTDIYEMAGLLELVSELLPARKGVLDAGVSTNKIVAVLTALPEKISKSQLPLPVILAALATTQRLAGCIPVLDESSAIGLARSCLKWATADVSATDGDAQQIILLTAVSRAVGALSKAASALLDDSLSVVGPVMRQIGEQLVDTCVLSEVPIPDGVLAVTQLARLGYLEVPEFSKLYPVIVSGTPRLVIELLRLILSAPDIVEYVRSHLDGLVRLVSVASKALADLGVSLDEFSEAIDSDEYIRSAGLRLLSSLLLVTRCAEGMAVDAQKHEELSDLLSQQQVLSSAMPWVCALLGLGSSTHNAFNAKLWDASADFDWETWAAELAINPASEQLFRVLAHHLFFGVAWAFPSTFRLWWTGLSQGSRAISIAVEQFVTKHISSTIVASEIGRIRSQDGEAKDEGSDDNVENTNDSDGYDLHVPASKPTAIAKVLEEYDDATIHAGATQVSLSYTVDESTLEIVVRLPQTYPLALPVFESAKRVAVSEKRWRTWLVSAQALMARNKRLDTVCAQLLGNIGAHFAGVEDCAICYSAVGALDNTLPGKQCKTCKNKFHRMCLFKWFKTSNQSTCPLCRNIF